jgi:hypothetical protein
LSLIAGADSKVPKPADRAHCGGNPCIIDDDQNERSGSASSFRLSI